ncbi:MAG TPA: ferritin-like domain-containing protein [Kofleriaceae bacterium]|nr:ferritin-like domain-containing protein [Kofleriaceae bacterium]
MEDLIRDALFSRLFDEAERVRWTMTDVPWQRIDRAEVTPGLIALVREIAFSELTTFSATRRFLSEFADDPDLAQWMSVWFYEETKHPQVLLRWLHQVGVSVDASFILRGRATAPFMKSRMGTLVTNVISEMVAASNYTALHRNCREPVLSLIGRRLAADEARHAASFYAFARRWLERSARPDDDRRDAIKVLYLWFQEGDLVRHPVNEFHGRQGGRTAGGAGASGQELADTMGRLGLDLVAPRDRIFRLIGTLTGVPLDGQSDLREVLRRLGGERPAAQKGAGQG